MEYEKNTPIYVQIIYELKRRISVGELSAGSKLPSVRDLAEELKVNPNTIVRVYQELEREGVTETRRGMGTFVADNEQFDVSSMKKAFISQLIDEFVQKALQTGVPKAEILELVTKALN